MVADTAQQQSTVMYSIKAIVGCLAANLSKQVQSAHPTPPFSLIVDIIIIYALMTYPVVRKLNYEPMNLASHRECYFVAAAS